jgi:nitrate/nitrite transporter NarK
VAAQSFANPWFTQLANHFGQGISAPMLGLLQFIKSNLRWLAGGLLLAFFSSFGQTFFISQFSGEIREEFELSDGQFGLIYMAGTLASALSLVWLGKVLDHVAVTRVTFCVIICLALACIGNDDAHFADDHWQVVFCRTWPRHLTDNDGSPGW